MELQASGAGGGSNDGAFLAGPGSFETDRTFPEITYLVSFGKTIKGPGYVQGATAKSERDPIRARLARIGRDVRPSKFVGRNFRSVPVKTDKTLRFRKAWNNFNCNENAYDRKGKEVAAEPDRFV